jgi:tetratricopeptide (TPR) repeat protein
MMSRTARLWRGAGPLTLSGLLLTGASALADDPSPSLTGQLVLLGRQATDQGHPSDAVAFYRKALELDPANSEAQAALADPGLIRLAMQDPAAPPAPAPPDDAQPPARSATIEQANEQDRIRAQQLTADIQDRIARARGLLNNEQPEQAITTLRLALASVDSSSDVSDTVRNGLRRQLQVAIQSAVRREEDIQARQLERLRLQATLTQRARSLATEAANQETVRAMMIRFDALMEQGVYNSLYNSGMGDIAAATAPFYEARLLAQQARALEPLALAPVAGVFVSQTENFLAQSLMFEELKEFRAIATLSDVDRAAVPFPDTITIEYPDAAWFGEITERRIRRYESTDLVQRDPKTLAILDALKQPISMPFPNETPIEEILNYIKTATQSERLPGGIPMYVDPAGLTEAEITMSSPVTVNLEGVPLKTSLRLLLKQIGLTYTVKDGLMTVTAELSANQPTEIRVYPVADLAIIPLSLMGGGGGGMGGMGGMGGGMGGMGGGMGGMGGGMGGMGGGMGGMGGGMGGMGGGFGAMPVQDPGADPAGPGAFQQKKSN